MLAEGSEIPLHDKGTKESEGDDPKAHNVKIIPSLVVTSGPPALFRIGKIILDRVLESSHLSELRNAERGTHEDQAAQFERKI